VSGDLYNAGLSVSLQLPFIVALGLFFDIFRHHSFALGSAFALASCVLVHLLSSGAALWASAALATLIATLLLGFLQFCVFEPLKKRRSGDEILIATLGASIVIEQAAAVYFGDRIRFAPANAEPLTNWYLGTGAQEVSMIVGFGLVAVIYLLLRLTEPGLRLIALGESPLLFKSLGWRERPWLILALVFVAVIISVSAVAAVPLMGARPGAGFPLVLLGLLTRIAGGPAHRLWFILTGIAVIALDQLAAVILPGAWRTIALFGALFLLIVFRSHSRPAA
jgi:branched-chain amino acid transport system permease protein